MLIGRSLSHAGYGVGVGPGGVGVAFGSGVAVGMLTIPVVVVEAIVGDPGISGTRVPRCIDEMLAHHRRDEHLPGCLSGFDRDRHHN